MRKQPCVRLFAALCLCALMSACAGAPQDAAVIVMEMEPSAATVAKPQLTPAPSRAPTIRIGDTGAQVDALQTRLVALGYMPAQGKTGVFDARTLHCVNLLLMQAGHAQVSQLDGYACALLYSQAAPTCAYTLAGYIIGIDPGHQAKQNSALEPVSPGSAEMKKKVSSGTSGRWSNMKEYEVNLNVALLVSDLLTARGAIVVMTRTTNDVDISNAERAMLFNEAMTDYALRLHCNGSGNENRRGAFVLVPKENPFLDECERAAKLLLEAYCMETGLDSLGLTPRGDQTGFNWCERMIINLEMGHMSNRSEDRMLGDAAFQSRMAAGVCKGVERYFQSE